MYNYSWDPETGGYILNTKLTGVIKELRPVYREELISLGFDKKFGWKIPTTSQPIMWAEGRNYIYYGEKIAEAKGGSMFSLPEINTTSHNLEIKPIDIENMIKKNKQLMVGIVQKTLHFIYDTYKKYENRVDMTYVAFSGGKDSIVLLDLVQRALPHDAFKVIFGDTTMEFISTYNILEQSRKRWMDLSWHIAKSEKESKITWMEYGPPSRTLRWCCSIHKSAPSILKIKELLAKERCIEQTEINGFKTLAYLGIRAEESDARSTYGFINDGNKHNVQINCNPILHWNTSELFLYILEHKLPFNELYKMGSHRVGCVLCPMSSQWYESITNNTFRVETEPYVNIIKSEIKKDYSSESEWDKYLAEGGWKHRASGKMLRNPQDKIIEINNEEEIKYIIRDGNYIWDKWIKTISTPIQIGKDKFQIDYKTDSSIIMINKTDSFTTLTVSKPRISLTSRRFTYLLRNCIYKSAYCSNCMVCMVECPNGAINITSADIIIGDCIHCEKCLEVGRHGCLVCMSKMSRGEENMSKGNIDRYKNFGFREEWLKIYLEDPVNFWTNDRMGIHMFLSFKVWSKEGGILEKNNSPSGCVSILQDLGHGHILTWTYILNNLAYNSAIMKWFIQNCEFNTVYQNSDLLLMLGDNYSETTKKMRFPPLKIL